MNSGLMNSVLMNLAYEQCAISAQCMHVCMCVCQDALAYNYVEPLIRQLFTILAENKLIILIASYKAILSPMHTNWRIFRN